MQEISTQIEILEKQLQDSLTLRTDNSQNIHGQNEVQNVTNMPKMQQMMKIFINSLKLNQKLYNSIVQKQSKITSGTNQFLIITAQTDSKIQDALKRTKQLYEDTVHQNQKARFMLDQFITPIRQQMKSKVDETTLTLQMKMLLDEYDVMGHQISYDVTEQQKVKQDKRKSANSQTLSFLRDKILPVLSHIEHKVQTTIDDATLMSNRIEELNAKTIQLQNKLIIQEEIIDQMERKNTQLVNGKINDANNDKKMKDSVRFMMKEYSSQLQATIEKINKSIKNLTSSLNQQLQSLKTSLSLTIANNKTSQTYLKSQLQIHQNKISQHSNSLHQKSLQFSILQNKLKIYDENAHLIAKISQKVQNLLHKLQKGQFKSQNQLKGPQFQNLFKKLHEFQFNSKKIKQFEKDLEERNMTLKGQLQGIRDILSKKANFSDILLHIEGKVDKREFKELKLRLFEDEKNMKSELKNKSLQLSKQSEGNRSWKKRHIKSRSFFSPSPAQKHTDLQSEPHQVKRFKLGFNHEFLLSNDILKKEIFKTQYLRKSIANNNSKIQNYNTET